MDFQLLFPLNKMNFIAACPKEILIKIFGYVPVYDLAACAEVSKGWNCLLKGTVLNRESRAFSRVSEINEAFVELLKETVQKPEDVEKARKLLALPELNVNAYANRTTLIKECLLSTAINKMRPDLAMLILEREDLDVNARDSQGNSPLHDAAMARFSKVIVKIASHASYARGMRNADGRFALHVAIKHSEFGKDLSSARELLRAGDSPVDGRDETGYTALHLAVYYGGIPACRMLVEGFGADPNLRAPGLGRTALHLAAQGARSDVARYLVSLPQVDVNCRTDFGDSTPLHLAAGRGHFGVVLNLLECERVDLLAANGAGLNAMDMCRKNEDQYLAGVMAAWMARRRSREHRMGCVALTRALRLWDTDSERRL